MFNPSPESGPETFDPNMLSREQLRKAVEVANTTLFRTDRGVVDVYGNETTIEGEGDCFLIFWGSTDRIADFAQTDEVDNAARKYKTFAEAKKSLEEGCKEMGYSIRER